MRVAESDVVLGRWPLIRRTRTQIALRGGQRESELGGHGGREQSGTSSDVSRTVCGMSLAGGRKKEGEVDLGPQICHEGVPGH